MASITKIGNRWRALVRRKGHPSYCKTFGVKAHAEAWARRIESEIDGGTSPRAESVFGRKLTVAAVIDTYVEMREQSGRPVHDSASEFYQLAGLKRLLGTYDAGTLSVDAIVGFCRVRAEEGAGPYTINMDVSKLGTVMRYAAPMLKVKLPDVVHEARPLLSHLKLIGGGGVRFRRAEGNELPDLLAQLTARRGKRYADAVEFAALTTMRRGEITRIRWEDVDEAKRLVLVRDRKDPRSKKGNDMWVPLLGPAWDLLQAQPRDDVHGRIFPLHPQTLSKYFKEARTALGIDNLRLHDMRHEGTSQLFEAGFQVPEVAMVTGHKNWKHLKRYTNLRPEMLHEGPAAVRAANLASTKKKGEDDTQAEG
ncbi:site-specific integrase [Delftia tsuruhatensis]|uniref:Site-specific integrase n=1 Tax=Delftia lacustris TaxID=558537 RepID=A0A7T2YMG3_9BURK|nr:MULTISPECIES: site-specific integrase [Delftia]QPS78583.1 site-specific integrase [Delftia lacustris]TDF26246.1 site-specific integrase [Delftia tsuruhatensis]